MVGQSFIPYCPLNLPNGPEGSPEQQTREVLAAVSKKAHIDLSRAVEPIYNTDELSSPDPSERSVEEELIGRYVKHVRHTAASRRLTDNALLVLRYRNNPSVLLSVVQRLYQELPIFRASGVDKQKRPRKDRRVLLIENLDRLNHFRTSLSAFGVVQDEIHSGGILHVNVPIPNLPRFADDPWRSEIWFLITWQPVIPLPELGNLLDSFLNDEKDYLVTDDRMSMTPGMAVPAYEIPAAVSPTDTRRDPPSPVPPKPSKSHFDEVSKILANVLGPKRRP